MTFYFLPADIVTQILNFGLPAPIDVQVQGNDVHASLQAADKLLSQFRQVPGLGDLRIQQPADQPKLHITVDRTKASQAGLTEQNVANSMLVTLSGSFQTQPTFWLSPQNGVSYAVAVQAPQYSVQSLQDLQSIPIASSASTRPEILGDVSTITRGSGLAVVSHYNIRRVVDILRFGGWPRSGRAWRAILQRIVDANRKNAAARFEHRHPRADRDYADLVHRPVRRPGVRHRAGLPADRGQFPIVAGPVHHHHGAARRAGRNRGVPVRHAHRA